MKPTKDIFVVHTKSNHIHLQLYNGLSKRLNTAGISIWQYEDWDWQKSHIDFNSGAFELIPDIDREILEYRPPRRIQGGVDRETLHSLITHTPAVLIFELPKRGIPSGVKEEIQIIDKELDRLFPFGHFALVRFGTDGYFACRYPMHCGALLDMGQHLEISNRVIDQLALFVLRMLIHKDMISQMWGNQTTDKSLESLCSWVEKSAQIAASCDFMTKLEPDEPIVQLVEEVLAWMVYFVRELGADVFWEQAPILATWVKNRFDDACHFTDLHEEGLLNLITLLRCLPSQRIEMLIEIFQKPIYRESDGVQAISWKVLIESSRGIASAQDQMATEPLIDVIASGHASDNMFSTLLEGLSRLAQESDTKVRQHTTAFIRKLIKGGSLDESAIGLCLSAFSRVAEPQDTSWLYSFLDKHWSEAVQLNSLLCLTQLIGVEVNEKFNTKALEFIERATPSALRTVGSVSWRINQDVFYDALLRADPGDEKMVAIVIYSLIKSRNPRAFVEIIGCLSSQSPYLRELSGAVLYQLVDRCSLSNSQIQQLVTRTKSLVNDTSELVRFGTILFLMRSSQKQYIGDANDMLHHFLSTGNVGRVRILMINGGLGLPDWPVTRELRLMLFHPSPIIRGTAAFLAGNQRRKTLIEELKVLQGDPSKVPVTTIISNNAMKDIGKTVAQSANLALDRISGKVPEVNLKTW